MNKDVIYIDVEDDITTIIGKIKNSKEKIIALVPPNRVGVLQSAVNMRLLKRASDQAKKRVVLISNSQSLVSLAAAAKIPAAKNLQSKPELVEVPVFKIDDDDVIDGNSLPIGEFDKSAKSKPNDDTVDKVIQASGAAALTAAESSVDSGSKQTAKKAKGTKVPNFAIFRKKLFLIIAAGILLLAFLIWAIWFAPRATVVISAKTTTATVDENVTLNTTAQTAPDNGVIKALRQEQKSEVTVEFTPTGKKEVGDKAKGQVRLFSDSNRALGRGINIPAGTALTSQDEKIFYTDTAVSLNNDNPERRVVVTAGEIGTSYNGINGSLRGAPSTVEANFSSPSSGGTSREVTVVSQEDVGRATDILNEKKTEGLEDKLKEAFGSSGVIIDESYKEERSTPTPSVAVNAEASGPVSLASTTTAVMFAIDKIELTNYLKARIDKEIEGNSTQKIYEDGSDEVKFAQFVNNGQAATVRITANGTVGPTVDESRVKEDSKGRTYGEIQSALEAIEGVNDVDVKFWPFWVRTVPGDVDRIKIEFKLENAS